VEFHKRVLRFDRERLAVGDERFVELVKRAQGVAKVRPRLEKFRVALDRREMELDGLGGTAAGGAEDAEVVERVGAIIRKRERVAQRGLGLVVAAQGTLRVAEMTPGLGPVGLE